MLVVPAVVSFRVGLKEGNGRGALAEELDAGEGAGKAEKITRRKKGVSEGVKKEREGEGREEWRT